MRIPARLRATAAIAWLCMICITTASSAGLQTVDIGMRVESVDGELQVWADNHLAGPVEVMLHADGSTATGNPALPARATVPALASILVSRLSAKGTRGISGLRLDTVPGSVNVQLRDVEYTYPLQTRELRIEQGWGGHYSHDTAEQHHAVDFATDLGTTVVAARDGVVMQLGDGTPVDQATGNGRGQSSDAGQVRILHDDGSMALYAHLQPDRMLVTMGQRVRRGEPIAHSGNSGTSTGPHLHFVVQINRGMHLESIPFRMFSPRGILRFSESQAGGQ